MQKCHPHLERHFCRLQIQWKVPPFEAHSISSPTCASLRSIFLCCQLNMIIMNSRDSDIKKLALNKQYKQNHAQVQSLSCLQLCAPMNCSLPGSSVHGIFQARTLQWVAIAFSGGIFLTQGSNLCLLHWQVNSVPLSHPGSS